MFLKNSFLLMLVKIVIVIGLSEVVVMIFLEEIHNASISLSPKFKAIVDTALLILLSVPFLWWLVLRPMYKQLKAEHIRIAEQIRLNSELRNVLDKHALVSITDLNGAIIYINEKYCLVSGYSPQELLGNSHKIMNSGYHDNQYIENMWHTITSGRIWQGEFCNRRKDGSLFWADSTIAPLLNEQGEPVQYLTIRQEITHIRESQIELKQFRQALNASTNMILIADKQGNIKHVNPALCEFTGWREEELIGQQPSLLDSPDANPQTLLEMQQQLSQNQSWSGHLLNRRHGIAPARIQGQTTLPNPLEYWADVTITPIINEDDKTSGYVQIQRDISAQLEQEAALRQEAADVRIRLGISEVLQQPLPINERLTQVLDILFDLQVSNLQRRGGIFIKSRDEDCLEMLLLHGQFTEEFIRCEQKVPLGECLCGRVAVSGEFLVSDDCFCDPRHEHQYEGIQAHGHYIVPIANSDLVIGVLFLYTDPYPIKNESRTTMLTQVGNLIALALLQEQAANALASARDAAVQASQVKSDFLSNMSHEIRTPMNGVLGMLNILKETELSREQFDMIDTAVNSAEALLTVINDILDFSKLEAGKVEVETIQFNLPELVEEICALQANRAHNKNLELNCFVPATLPKCWLGDPIRIRQVLINLIGNAIKFTHHGEISVKVIAQDSINGVSTLRFEVKDSGIGITPETQRRLFQAFTQADSTTARRFGGTGLGLTISKNLVNLMGGVIGVESAINQGSCFWFNLPLTKVEQLADDTHAFDLSGKRVLVVDDNATNRTILEHHLKYWGMTVDLVDNCTVGLATLINAVSQQTPYDLLITDLQLPVVDGLTLAEEICKIPAIADIPRLLLSSGGFINEAELASLGIAESLFKPVRQEQLYEAIVRLLRPAYPDAKPAGAIENRRNSEALPDYTGKRVLIVEDNLVNQKVIQAMLGKFHLTLDFADNGQLALELLKKQIYDLVLMDCQMPVMDGYEATRIFRGQELQQGRLLRTPIVALTAHATVSAQETCLNAGMDDYLSKPINTGLLTKMLVRWLERKNTLNNQPPLSTETTAMPEESPPAPCWDETAALQYLENDTDLLDELIKLFIQTIPDQINELQAALAKGDTEALANSAHSIKGMSAVFCTTTVTGLAAQLETDARLNRDDTTVMASKLTTALNHLTAEFQQRQQP
jgi:PAS domain S-box-containing protein